MLAANRGRKSRGRPVPAHKKTPLPFGEAALLL